MDYETIKTRVDEILAKAQVTYAVRYIGESKTEDWKHDAWRVSFGPFETDYRTGLGHRKMPQGFTFGKHRGRITAGTIAHEENEALKKPVAPRAADVLHSLLMDATANDMSFREWCSEYGYSDDSISAFDTYRKCCDIGAQLHKVFKRETLEELREAVREL